MPRYDFRTFVLTNETSSEVAGDILIKLTLKNIRFVKTQNWDGLSITISPTQLTPDTSSQDPTPVKMTLDEKTGEFFLQIDAIHNTSRFPLGTMVHIHENSVLLFYLVEGQVCTTCYYIQ